jgi:hypothetical protein
MWLKKLLTTIDETSVGDWVENKRKVISDTDLDRIDVENVRSFFGLTTDLARGLCDLAVRDGVLEKFIAIECPNSLCRRTLTTVSLDESLEDEYLCVNCEFAGREPYIFDSEDVKTRVLYRLDRHSKENA